MLQSISLLVRKIKAKKGVQKQLAIFAKHKTWIDKQLAAVSKLSDAVLLIRLDDIGDYLLFRNFIPYYCQLYKGKKVVLLGNVAWKSIYEQYDAGEVAEVLWVDKKQYFSDDAYKQSIWTTISSYGFEEVVSTSVSRNILLDDLCALASKAVKRTGAKLQYEPPALLHNSNKLYHELIDVPHNVYEFDANKVIAEKITQQRIHLYKPELPVFSAKQDWDDEYICLFIGANAISRRWTVTGWKGLIQWLSTTYPHQHVYLIGGPTDMALADEITTLSQAQQLENKVGKLSLFESVGLIQHATLLVSNNSMAYHVSMSSLVPTVIVTNGENPYRFTTFDTAISPNVSVVYPQRFLKETSKEYALKANLKYTATKADIRSITAEDVIQTIKEMNILKINKSATV